MNVLRSIASGLIAAAALSFAAASVSLANTVWDGSKPAPGVFFYWYLPSFYAGFAPKTQDPTRVHIELSRGNQVRLTLVLGEEQIDNYLADLHQRRTTYQELIDENIIELATNMNFERFVEKLDEHAVSDTLAHRDSMGADAFRAKSIETLKALNPGRVFEIRIPAERIVTDWHATLAEMSDEDLKDKGKRLDAANAILPGRVNLYELDKDLAADLANAVSLARSAGADDSAFQESASVFLDEATGGHYQIQDGVVEATEFTAIYPVGTIRAWKKTPYGRVPEFGVTGVWPMISRDQGRGISGMVDYLSSNPGYGFIPLIAYQHAGGVYYNAFHNAGVRSPMDLRHLPPEWKKVPGERNPDKTYKQLWLVSRGPASHGCTRMDSGQMSEMRNILPSANEAMVGIPTFRNLPRCYEVFDVDGDGTGEVMGVEYYIAYDSKKHLPTKAYAPNNRKEYYAWLYGDNISYNPDGSAVIKQVPICRFIGKRKAVEAAVLTDVPLYEAPFTSEPIQFYELKKAAFDSRKGFEFNRTLRRVGEGYSVDRGKLFLN